MHLAETEAARTKAAGTTVSRTTRQHVQSARSLLQSAAIVAVAAAGFTSLIGCGASYRPVVSAINPVGPSAQPTKYAVAISNPSPGTPGLVTIVDFSGDTVLVTANIGVNPKYLVLNAASTTSTTGVTTTANTGYTINGDGTLNVFDISPALITSQILETTLLAGANPVSLFAQGANTYVAETGRNAIGEFLGSPLALRQELAVQNPVYVVGLSGGPRAYALSQGATATATGSAIAIDTTTNTPTSTIPLGIAPVYGIITNDGRRAFVLNQGSGTVSVINAQTNQLDTFSGTIVPPATAAPATSTIPVGTNPLWADFAPTRSEMVVANAGTGTNNGTLSIVSIPLCNAAAQVTNVNCDPNNPVDAAGFGTVLASPQVGINPVMVTALQDGTRAYVANRGNPSLPCSTAPASGSTTPVPSGNCTVSVVNLSTNLVSATIPIAGRPLYIAATTGAPTGKVYVVCGIDAMLPSGVPDNSRNLTVIRTDIDALDTTIPLQGTGVSVRVTAQ